MTQLKRIRAMMEIRRRGWKEGEQR